ncbi:MAG TPA: RNA-binding protein [Verrucomicrobiae bacterium]
MISNERPSPYGRRPYQSHHHGGHGGYGGGYGNSKYSQPQRPPVQEDTLKSSDLQVERKNFVFALKENPRGRFLRITEDVGGRRDTIIIPSTGLAEFKRVIDEMVKAAESIPEKQPNPESL